ncbi:hypothetical protein Dimus_037358, partial [Dionaea muscipula]
MRLASLVTDEGSTVTESKNLGKEFIKYFKEILGTERTTSSCLDPERIVFGPTLTSDHQDRLSASFTEQDVWRAFASIQEDKAP